MLVREKLFQKVRFAKVLQGRTRKITTVFVCIRHLSRCLFDTKLKNRLKDFARIEYITKMTTKENKITLESIHDYFWTPVGTEGKPRGWVIDGALCDEKPGAASESRICAYFGSKNNYKSGFLYDFFTTHMGVGCCENVRDYFLPHTLQDAINKLDLDVKHYKNGKLNKKSLNYLKALFVVLDDYPAFDSFDASWNIVHLYMGEFY